MRKTKQEILKKAIAEKKIISVILITNSRNWQFMGKKQIIIVNKKNIDKINLNTYTFGRITKGTPEGYQLHYKLLSYSHS
jgi:hypothetical protein